MTNISSDDFIRIGYNGHQFYLEVETNGTKICIVTGTADQTVHLMELNNVNHFDYKDDLISGSILQVFLDAAENIGFTL